MIFFFFRRKRTYWRYSLTKNNCRHSDESDIFYETEPGNSKIAVRYAWSRFRLTLVSSRTSNRQIRGKKKERKKKNVFPLLPDNLKSRFWLYGRCPEMFNITVYYNKYDTVNCTKCLPYLHKVFCISNGSVIHRCAVSVYKTTFLFWRVV